MKNARRTRKKAPKERVRSARATASGGEDIELLEREQLMAELETLREAQIQVAHSQQLYAELFDHAPIPYINLTPAGLIQNANLAATALLGLKRPHLIRSAFRAFVAREDCEKFKNFLEDCKMGRGNPVTAELRLKLRNGTTRWAELLARPSTQFGTTKAIYRTVLRDITAAKHAASDLRESEARLLALLEQTSAGVARADLRGRFTFVNRQLCTMLGYDAEELRTFRFKDLVQPEERELTRLFRRLAHSGTSFQLELRMVRKDSTAVWMNLHVSALLNERGRPSFVAIVAIDVSERKAAEAALRKSEEQFRRAIEEAPVPVIMHAEDGKVIEISKTWTRLTGYKRGDMTTFEAWLNRAYGYGAERVRDHIRRIFEGEEATTPMEFEVHARSGEIRNWLFHASSVGTLSDGTRFIVGMAVDITERKQAEVALAASREQLRLIVENAREYAIFSLDLDRRITSWNIGAERLLGYKEGEVLGQSGDLIFTPEDQAAGEPLKETIVAVRDGRALDERWHVRKDGSRFWASGMMMPMHDSSDQTIGLVKIFRDETEARQTRQALERSRAELQVALQEAQQAREAAETAGQAKDHFMAVLSHELRTPLTPVLMAAHTLLRRKDLPEKVRDALVAIRRNIQIEARLVDDLLDVTRIARGKMELLREPMDLHEVIKHALEVCQPEVDSKRQKLQVSLKAANGRMEGDGQRLQQVVWNLLKNASKFTPEGGTIRVRTINVKDRFVLTVKDTGIGFEASDQDRIFNPFTQADQRITQRFGGLGLGLAIAKATTEAHEGVLSASSPGPGKGATFTVSLPVITPPNSGG